MALDDGEIDDFSASASNPKAGMLSALVLFLAFDTGTLTRLPDRKKLFSVRGEIDHILLPQREIRVWLPPGYESSGDARYPQRSNRLTKPHWACSSTSSLASFRPTAST